MRGFTLIELLVTVTIIVLVTGASIASYLAFNEARQLDVDVRIFLTELNKIRSKARFLEYPDDCTGLTDYTFEVSENDGRYNRLSSYATCAEGRRGESVLAVLNSTAFDSAATIKFSPITGNMPGMEDVDLTLRLLKGSQRAKVITVSHLIDTNNEVVDEQ